jgi:CheY-like chemotaxis protein
VDMSSRTTPVVLVADDEPSMLALVSRHVKTLGFEVLEASDGETAWGHACQALPDLVVLDVMMPGMSGWEVCRRIRENVALAHTGVIMLTGIGQSLNELTSPLYGADAYIDKPFEFKELDEKVRAVLSSRGHNVLEPAPMSEEPGSDEEADEDAANDAAAASLDPPTVARNPLPPVSPPPRREQPEEESFYAAVTLRPPPPKSQGAGAADDAPLAKPGRMPAMGKSGAAKKPVKKPAVKKPAKKAAPKKAAPKKAAPKKAAPKKAAPKKAAPKKAAPKKAAPKKAAPKKAAPKKAAKKAPKAAKKMTKKAANKPAKGGKRR